MHKMLRRVGRGLMTALEVFSFVLRELGGWGLIFLALVLGDYCLTRIDDEQIAQAALLIPLIIFTFRGGIHLLKVSVAARICLQARDRAAAQS